MAASSTGRLLPPPACTLPYDLLLEIVARSDVATVVRSAATCKPLRRDILSPAFIRRVCQHGPNGAVVPPFILGYLHVHNKAGFSLVHPATLAATSFSEDHLAPFLSRRAAADLGKRHVLLTSRNGLVVLGRRGVSGICVYDPMTGDRLHLPPPLNILEYYPDPEGYGVSYTFVLLTAADGIGCSFLVLATDSRFSGRIQLAASSDVAADGTSGWGPVISVTDPGGFRYYHHVHPHSCAVVLDGVIHWLMYRHGSPNWYILTYDVPRHGTSPATTTGSIEVPKACLPDRCQESDLHLTSSPVGRLSLLVADRFTISIWLLSESGSAGRWARQSVIDTEAIVVGCVSSPELPSKVDFVSSAWLRSGAVLLRPFFTSWDFMNDEGDKGLFLLDVGTEEMRRVNKQEGFPYEVNMEARLSAMKIFGTVYLGTGCFEDKL